MCHAPIVAPQYANYCARRPPQSTRKRVQPMPGAPPLPHLGPACHLSAISAPGSLLFVALPGRGFSVALWIAFHYTEIEQTGKYNAPRYREYLGQ